MKASFTEIVRSLKCSTAAPGQARYGSRARRQQERQAVGVGDGGLITMLVAPGPIGLVAIMICLRFLALL
ncbi:MAG: hypothetical protein R3C69_03610 [Geminicoccaceae bacterium]